MQVLEETPIPGYRIGVSFVYQGARTILLTLRMGGNAGVGALCRYNNH
jgi:hypothetical protein